MCLDLNIVTLYRLNKSNLLSAVLVAPAELKPTCQSKVASLIPWRVRGKRVIDEMVEFRNKQVKQVVGKK